ncbi:MAG: toxin-antitoxin system YwqK family antitoxin [Bacteroidetes bacterium]|nr:toxin-antitoxin system YwqK family antitoxin [Bacteroidota bacterium]
MLIILLVFNGLCCNFELQAQNKPDSLVPQKYFYISGIVSSEGYLRSGQPDGFWKTYYENGKLKSEGNRKNFELDSLWKFYDEDGKLLLELNYRNGKKNGLKKTYPEGEILAENFVNDVKQGPTTYYYQDQKVKKIIPFVNGLEQGISREFDHDGNVITIIEYKKGFILSKEYVNRKDKNGLKMGKWLTFWESGAIHIEGTYSMDRKNGYFREYTMDGKLFKISKYIDGELQPDAEEIAKIDERADYYASGKVKTYAQYKANQPDGLWKEYGEDGKLLKSYVYSKGFKVGEGITDEAGKRQGAWKEYWENGKLRAEGKYKGGKRIGYWKYYYENEKLEEEGNYDDKGRADGDWKWYYDEGQLMKEQAFSEGKEDGLMTEYDEKGKIISKGEYIEGQKQGKWTVEYGDHKEEGGYVNDQRDGFWKYYYGDGTHEYEGKFVEDLPDGRHISYWENGNKKEEGIYVMGVKEGEWIKYNDDGTPFLIVTYKNGTEKKYDGVKVIPELKDGE